MIKGVKSRKSVPISGRDGKHRHILFVTDFYLEEVLAGIVGYAREAGWVLNANMRFHGMLPPLTTACDGILTTVGTERVRNWLAKRSDCPIVRMTSTSLNLPYPAVEADYLAAGQAGARHLLELGHVNFAFYQLTRLPETQDTWKGFESELVAKQRQACRLDLSVAYPGRDPFHIGPEERQRWLAGEIQRLPKPLAVMGDDDRRALELLATCETVGLRVPEDVAILGCDNHWVESGMARTPLSSVDMNFKGVGREAAKMLDHLMRGGSDSTAIHRVQPVGVVARRSTAIFVTDSPGITAAVVYLREHFSEPLRLAALARLAGMSERMFQLEFKRQVGHSAREEIQNCRLACAARLLRDTNLKLEAVATECGLGSATQLCKYFTRAHKVSPNVWRARVKGSSWNAPSI